MGIDLMAASEYVIVMDAYVMQWLTSKYLPNKVRFLCIRGIDREILMASGKHLV